MIDIADVSTDLVMIDTQTNRAANILSVQLGALEYDPDMGIDLKYFLTEGIKFQNDSFKGYIVEQLAYRGINVNDVISTVFPLFESYNIKISPEETTTALVAR
jgi:hypothetical protein